ncbi:DMP19 family protein [Mesobacillus subterraneus]|uniref:DNA mimic protein DMP19 C-terminal domain-containing protein n=1 Tax=Mesobacillus subterraneus TaxID=285983 RepID=A0A3R9FHZ9_9BACI|nr:hypothetical protein [Mesobacillus subterraneus]RSD28457.1 hypothetical protein EJA10_05060 [Mesobacillus subterraneus]
MEDLLKTIERLIPLNDLKTKSPEEIVEIIAINLYNKENVNITDTDTFYKLPEIIRDIILIINFDTEVSMQGILGYLENTTGLYFKDTIHTFEKVQAVEDYQILANIEAVLEKYRITTSALRKNVNNQALHQITDFAKLHGHEYLKLAEEISVLADNLYVYHTERNVFDFLNGYISRKRDSFIDELKFKF